MRRPAVVFAATLAVAAVAMAQDYPKMKPGQWEMTSLPSKAGGAAPTKTTMCTDEAVQKELLAMGAGMTKDMCTKSEFKRDGSRFTMTAECTLGESKLRSRAVMTVSGDTAYRTEISATYNPPFMGMKDSQTILEGKYVGACRDGLVPGDMVMANGQKINLKTLATRTPPMPAGGAKPPTAPKAAPGPKTAPQPK